jgi:type IV pilus assembly protein PilB
VRSAKEKKVSFISELMGSGELSPAQLAHALSALAIPLLDLDAVDVQRLPKNIIDAKLVGQYHVLPLNKRAAGCSSPVSTRPIRSQRAHQVRHPAVARVGGGRARQAQQADRGQTGSANQALEAISAADFDFEVTEDTSSSAPPADVAEVEDAPVVRFLQKMLVDAINMRASDLHFEPYEFHYRVRFRVDGELREITQPPLAIKDKLASRIKVISRLDISEKRVPQDGRMKLRFGNKSIDFRVSTLPTLFGEKIVIRILDPPAPSWASRPWATSRPRRSACCTPSPPLRHGAGDRPDRLGQDGVALHLPEHPEPAGREHLHGRRPGRNQPAGHQPGQRQRQGRPDLRRALKSFLRQDPDIIMVGEIRDLETADIAIKAAQTGHLVLSTLHTNDAPPR